MYDERALVTLLAVGGFIIFLLVILAIAMYIFMAVGLYRLAANRHIENPWLAFIPIANLYILGMLVGKLKIDSFEIPSLELVLPIGCVVTAVIKFIPLIGWLASIAYLILTILTLYKLYGMYRPQSAALWTVLSVVLPFMGPIFLFIMRNDTPVAY